MIKLTLKQAEVLQNYISEMMDLHEIITPEEEEVFAFLDAAIDNEKDNKLIAKQA